jgi:hypothetical protein
MTDPDGRTEVNRLAAAWLSEGVPVPEVQRRLVERGVSGAEASEVVDAVLAGQVAADTARQRAGDRRALIQGVGLCGAAAALVGLAFSPLIDEQYRLHLFVLSGPVLLWGVSRLVRAWI